MRRSKETDMGGSMDTTRGTGTRADEQHVLENIGTILVLDRRCAH